MGFTEAGPGVNRGIDFGLVAMEVAFCAVFAIRYSPPPSPAVQEPGAIVVAANPAALFAEPNLPKCSETLTGKHQETVTLVMVAADDQTRIEAFRKAGWYRADPITPKSALKIAWAALTNGQYLHAPMHPSFWSAQVNTMGFEKPTKENSVRQRHHARFWKTRFITAGGARIYVGTASLDTEIEWAFTHAISPDIDTDMENHSQGHDTKMSPLTSISVEIVAVKPLVKHKRTRFL